MPTHYRQVNTRFVFPRWTNALLPAALLSMVGGPLYVVTLVGFGASPRTINVGYTPKQPVEYSHARHVGELGMDCRYCHTTVESAAFAAVPPTQTCMNCHTHILSDDPQMLSVKQSYESGRPIEWVKVHDLAEYVYFDHAAHVSNGVGCAECHGRVDRMETVYQAQTLSMGWCLECHREPAPRLRPREEITNMSWGSGMTKEQRTELGEQLAIDYDIRPKDYMDSCTRCHR